MKYLLSLILTLSILNAETTFYSGDPVHKISLLTYGGLPESKSKAVKVLFNTSHITGYSEEMKNPLWTVYRYGNFKGEYTDQNWERPPVFLTDRRTEAKVIHDHYTSTGYDRGHQAPNSGMLLNYGQMTQLETYLMSNICPQNPNLNRYSWMRLEQYVREVISQDDTTNKSVKNTYVITGPIFSDNPAKLKGDVDGQIPIPSHFYKIVVFSKGYRGTKKAVSFIFPQDAKRDANFREFYASIDEIEEKTGLEFFTELTSRKQSNLESVTRDVDLEVVGD